MPAPASYSETIFADYLASVLGELAPILGWDAGSVQVIEAMNDALLELGLASISAATTPLQIRGLRALGRRAIWRAVAQATAGDYSVTDNGQKLERQQVNEQARALLEIAEADCRGLGVDPAYAVSIVSVKRPHDPYQVIPDTERVP